MNPSDQLGSAAGPIVGERLKQLRKTQGIGYAELSRKLAQVGCAIAELGLRKIENGERKVSVDDLLALAYALDVAPVTLLVPDVDAGDIVEGTGLTAAKLWAWVRAEEPFGAAPGDRGGRARLAFLARSQPGWVLDEYAKAVEAVQAAREPRGE